MAEKTISLPFRIDPYGKVADATTQEKIWADRVRGVLGTTFRERLLRPEFGASIVESLFDEAEEQRLDLNGQVREAFTNFLPDLTLLKVDVVEQLDSGTMEINISYALPNEKESSVNIGFVEILGNNPPLQQLVSYQERPNEQ